MKNKLDLIRKSVPLNCTWVPTDNMKRPLACIWKEERGPLGLSAASCKDETGGVFDCDSVRRGRQMRSAGQATEALAGVRSF
jgi:hypothetical protein